MSTLQTTQKELIAEFNSNQTNINSNISKMVILGREAVDLAIKNGGILIKLKKTVKHGEWESFMSSNITLSNKQCGKYMRLNKYQHLLEDSDDAMSSINNADQYISMKNGAEKAEKAEQNRELVSQDGHHPKPKSAPNVSKNIIEINPLNGGIYIAQCGDFNIYKIGQSSGCEERLATLQTGNPFELKIIFSAKCADAYRIEKSIQEKLTAYHKRGEWFECHIDKVFDAIESTIDLSMMKIEILPQEVAS